MGNESQFRLEFGFRYASASIHDQTSEVTNHKDVWDDGPFWHDGGKVWNLDSNIIISPVFRDTKANDDRKAINFCFYGNLGLESPNSYLFFPVSRSIGMILIIIWITKIGFG